MSVYLRDELNRPIWYFRICIDGKRYNRPVPEATSMREAEKAETVFKANLLQGKYELADKLGSMPFKNLVDEYEKFAKTTKKSYKTEQCRVDKLREYFGEKRLKDITPIIVERYRHDRKHTPKVRQKKVKGKLPSAPKLVCNASINREVSILRKMFSIAVENGWIDKNPCVSKKVKPLRENSHRERVLTPEEELSLLAACSGESEYLKPILICALHTGMRKSEILNLKWQYVDLDKGFITVTKTKSGKDRDIPLSQSLRAAFEELHVGNKSDFVFANPETGLAYFDVKRCYARVCKQTKISGLTFHDLRHTAATRMVASGIDLVVVRDILGHASLTTTQRYAHPVPERKLQAVLALDAYVANHEKQKQSVKVVSFAKR